jgi:hypothetical protein
MNDKELAKELENWFKNNINNPNKWNRGAVGPIIKQTLNNLNNWRNAPRGNPAKGYEEARKQRNT